MGKRWGSPMPTQMVQILKRSLVSLALLSKRRLSAKRKKRVVRKGSVPWTMGSLVPPPPSPPSGKISLPTRGVVDGQARSVD